MITTTLFGLVLAPLYTAIAQVESDRGATSDNVYQLRKIYIDDVNEINLNHGSACIFHPFPPQACRNRHAAEMMMRVYWYHWGSRYQRETGKPVTYEVLARIHNGGPNGWKKPETVSYWNRVKAALANQTAADVEAWAKGGAQ